MKKITTSLLIVILLFPMLSFGKPPAKEFYELRIYHLKTGAQEQVIDEYLSKALLPALHRAGIGKTGVFKPVEQDTSELRILVLIPYPSLNDVIKTQQKIEKDAAYLAAGSVYLNATYDQPVYTRMETIFIQAFSHNPKLVLPELKGPRDQRVYELRSYEGYTEKIFKNKVHMFNEGGEVTLFKRLGFNATFYGEVVAGSKMPNLMYMTTFENQASRDEHWKTFSNDPEWKKLSSMSEYKNNVSKIDIYFVRPTSYSDY